FTANEEDHKRLAGRVKKAITVFEPRLKNVHVRLQPVSGNEKVLKMVIEADMVVENVRKPVSFLTVVQNGTVEIHEK
ncbi:MAG: GPW/gp25 family protein, partial [Desulfobacterales bacterium]|nr:GPW/gp25 family protein [Desulfobacterales bacterium]